MRTGELVSKKEEEITVARPHLNPPLPLLPTLVDRSQPKGQWLPDLRLRINLRNSARLKHGGDTGTYDRKGRFDEKIFDRVFELWDQGGKGGLSLGDIGRMIREQRAIMDPVGLIAESLEWCARLFYCHTIFISKVCPSRPPPSRRNLLFHRLPRRYHQVHLLLPRRQGDAARQDAHEGGHAAHDRRERE